MSNDFEINGKTVKVNGLNIYYLEAGKGETVILLHGWPTSSYLWRNIIPTLAKTRRVIAPDLPGYGRSDKPPDISYTFNNMSRIFEGFIDVLGIKKTALVVHDFGGPIGLLWAIRNPEKVERLAILDTIIHPDLPILMRSLFFALKIPYVGDLFANPFGVSLTIRLGVSNKKALTQDVLEAYRAPFISPDVRRAFSKTIKDPNLGELKEISQKIQTLKIPISIIYGENDILMASEMQRIEKELPDASVISIPDCNHFLQEDQPEKVSDLLSKFLSR